MIAKLNQADNEQPTTPEAAKPHRELWQFSHRDGWQPMETDHPLAGFPIPFADLRRPVISPALAETLTDAGFRSRGLVRATTGGILILHKATSPDVPFWFFGWGILLETRIRVVFSRMPDALAFFNLHRSDDIGATFHPVEIERKAAA